MTETALLLNFIARKHLLAFARQELVGGDDDIVRNALIDDAKSREALADILNEIEPSRDTPSVELVHIDRAIEQLEKSAVIQNETPHEDASPATKAPYKGRANLRRELVSRLREALHALGWKSPGAQTSDPILDSHPLSIPNNKMKAFRYAIEADRSALEHLRAGYRLLAPSKLLIVTAGAIAALQVDLSNISTI